MILKSARTDDIDPDPMAAKAWGKATAKFSNGKIMNSQPEVRRDQAGIQTRPADLSKRQEESHNQMTTRNDTIGFQGT